MMAYEGGGVMPSPAAPGPTIALCPKCHDEMWGSWLPTEPLRPCAKCQAVQDGAGVNP